MANEIFDDLKIFKKRKYEWEQWWLHCYLMGKRVILGISSTILYEKFAYIIFVLS